MADLSPHLAGQSGLLLALHGGDSERPASDVLVTGVGCYGLPRAIDAEAVHFGCEQWRDRADNGVPTGRRLRSGQRRICGDYRRDLTTMRIIHALFTIYCVGPVYGSLLSWIICTLTAPILVWMVWDSWRRDRRRHYDGLGDGRAAGKPGPA